MVHISEDAGKTLLHRVLIIISYNFLEELDELFIKLSLPCITLTFKFVFICIVFS